MTTSTLLTWDEICARHPDEWVVLVDVVYAEDGWISAARVATHDECVDAVIDRAPVRTETCDPVLTHTAGRHLARPRIEIFVENDNLIRPPC